MPSPSRVRSSPTPISILSDLLMDESIPRPIDLDEDIMGPSEHFNILDILKPSRSIDYDLYDLVGLSWKFIEDLEWEIMELPNFEKSLVIVEETLKRVVGIRDTVGDTCRQLETQLKESRMKIVVARKIQAKVEWALL